MPENGKFKFLFCAKSFDSMRRVFELQASWRKKNVSAIHYTVHYDPLVLPHLLGQKKAKIRNSRFLIENSYYIHAVSIWELNRNFTKFYCKFSNLVNVSALLHRVIKSEFFEPKKFKFLKNCWFLLFRCNFNKISLLSIFSRMLTDLPRGLKQLWTIYVKCMRISITVISIAINKMDPQCP